MHEFHISYSRTECCLHFSRGEMVFSSAGASPINNNNNNNNTINNNNNNTINNNNNNTINNNNNNTINDNNNNTISVIIIVQLSLLQ